jgi:hypothetical protein
LSHRFTSKNPSTPQGKKRTIKEERKKERKKERKTERKKDVLIHCRRLSET